MVEPRTKQEWVDYYERKTGGRFVLGFDEFVLFHPRRGFLTFFVNREDECIEVHHAVGDGKYWQSQAIRMLRVLGMKKVRFFTRRNPEAWMRRYGGHIRGYYMEVGIDETKETKI